MFIDQPQERLDCLFVDVVNSLSAIRFYFYKSAGFKPPQMMRHQTLLVAKPFSDICRSMGLSHEKVDDAPSRLIAESFKKELVGFVWINTLHNMNYNSYCFGVKRGVHNFDLRKAYNMNYYS